MHITIKLLDERATSAGKKRINVKVKGPISIKGLYELARDQEGQPNLKRELEGFLISYRGILLNHREALEKEVLPGEEILLLHVMDGG